MKASNHQKARTIFAFVSVHSEKVHQFIAPLDLAISEEHQVELLIDSSVVSYAEPPTGLEQRVSDFEAANRPATRCSEKGPIEPPRNQRFRKICITSAQSACRKLS